MNLLFLTPQLPYPPRQGTAIRNWGLINYLAGQHTITLHSFGTQAPAGPLVAACQRVVVVAPPRRSVGQRMAGLLRTQPDLARRMWSAEYDAALACLLAETAFDLVHIEGLEMAAYLPTLRRLAPAARLLYDAHNAEYVLQQRAAATDGLQPARWPWAAYSLLQARRLRRFEAGVCRAVHAVTCVSAIDADALRQLAPDLKPAVVPNGIDLADFSAHATTPQSAGTLVFTGKMDYRPNLDAALWFANEILPRIRAAWPDVRFLVVGQQPPPALLAMDGQNGVVVTGAVEDTKPYIAGAAVYVAPLRMGGGTRFKLLEAMALGRPIVSTTVGAEGFAVRHGRELLLADDPEAFAAAVLAVLEDVDQARALGEAGQNFVRAGYDWRNIGARLEGVYAGLFQASGYAG